MELRSNTCHSWPRHPAASFSSSSLLYLQPQERKHDFPSRSNQSADKLADQLRQVSDSSARHPGQPRRRRATPRRRRAARPHCKRDGRLRSSQRHARDLHRALVLTMRLLPWHPAPRGATSVPPTARDPLQGKASRIKRLRVR